MDSLTSLPGASQTSPNAVHLRTDQSHSRHFPAFNPHVTSGVKNNHMYTLVQRVAHYRNGGLVNINIYTTTEVLPEGPAERDGEE